MDTRLALLPEEEGKPYGTVKPVEVKEGQPQYGLSIGSWSVSSADGHVHIVLNDSIPIIIHEVATSKAIRAEMRASEKDRNGTEKKPIIILDTITKRFRQIIE